MNCMVFLLFNFQMILLVFFLSFFRTFYSFYLFVLKVEAYALFFFEAYTLPHLGKMP